VVPSLSKFSRNVGSTRGSIGLQRKREELVDRDAAISGVFDHWTNRIAQRIAVRALCLCDQAFAEEAVDIIHRLNDRSAIKRAAVFRRQRVEGFLTSMRPPIIAGLTPFSR
jgi:hypothetical protein